MEPPGRPRRRRPRCGLNAHLGQENPEALGRGSHGPCPRPGSSLSCAESPGVSSNLELTHPAGSFAPSDGTPGAARPGGRGCPGNAPALGTDSFRKNRGSTGPAAAGSLLFLPHGLGPSHAGLCAHESHVLLQGALWNRCPEDVQHSALESGSGVGRKEKEAVSSSQSYAAYIASMVSSISLAHFAYPPLSHSPEITHRLGDRQPASFQLLPFTDRPVCLHVMPGMAFCLSESRACHSSCCFLNSSQVRFPLRVLHFRQSRWRFSSVDAPSGSL